jgi:hypothetical protein
MVYTAPLFAPLRGYFFMPGILPWQQKLTRMRFDPMIQFGGRSVVASFLRIHFLQFSEFNMQV